MCWISVETQMPEDGSVVDCWIKGAEEAEGMRTTDVIFEDGLFILETHLGGCWVTHWRYPPAPPYQAPLKTVGGRSARIICSDRKGFGDGYPILALIADDGGNEIAVPYGSDLKCEKNHHFPGEDLSLPAPPEGM